MSDHLLPQDANDWLRAVEHSLANIDPRERDEIVDGLRSHIIESLAAGDILDAVLDRLGSPASIAASAAGEGLRADTKEPDPASYFNARRIVQVVAFGLALAAAAIIASLPSYVEVTADRNGEITSSPPSLALFNMAPAIAAVLVLSLVLTSVPLFFRGRAWRVVTIVSSILMVVLAIVGTGLSAWFIAPAAITSAVSAFVPTEAPSRSSRTMGSLRA